MFTEQKNMKNQEDHIKIVKGNMISYARPFKMLSTILGISPITIKNGQVQPHSKKSIAYTLLILSLVLLEFFVGIIYGEIVQGTHQYNIVSLTHLFQLVAENIISCVCLVNAIVLSRVGCENLNSMFRVQQLMSLLGIEYDFDSQRKIGVISLLFVYGLLFPLIFGCDYYLLFDSKTNTYFSLTSWIFIVIHVAFNAYALLNLIFILQVIKCRFKLLNESVRDLNKISVRNIISEIHVLNGQNAKTLPLSLKERVQMIKEAHDRLYRICAKGWISHNQVTLLEIVTSGILMTSYLYSVIGMVIDEEYDMNLLVYCCYWTLYRALVIVVLVLSNSSVCTQCNLMAIVIHDLLNRGETRDVYIQLKNFSLQRLHQKLKIMACGLFPVDYSLLFEITGSITTHLVILIQFKMLGDNSGKTKPEGNQNID